MRLVALLLLAACAGESVTETPTTDTASHVFVADTELADAASAAAQLWTDATAGSFAPTVGMGEAEGIRIRLGDTAGVCTGRVGPRGCGRPRRCAFQRPPTRSAPGWAWSIPMRRSR